MANNVVTKQALRETLKQLQSLMAYLPYDNLLVGTDDRGAYTTKTSYFMEYDICEKLREGEWVTFSAEVELGSGRSYMYLFNSTGWVAEPTKRLAPDSSGRVVATFQWKIDGGNGHVAENNRLLVRLYPEEGTSGSTYRKVKLERGKVATAWCKSTAERLGGIEDGLQGVVDTVTELTDIVTGHIDDGCHCPVVQIEEVLDVCPQVATLTASWEVKELISIKVDDDGQLIFAVSCEFMGQAAGKNVGYFPGAEKYGTVRGDRVVVSRDKIYVDANGKAYAVSKDGYLRQI